MNAIAEPLAPADAAAPGSQQHPRTPIDGAVYLPLALLRASPTNPRKHFDEAALRDLAESLTKHTQLQPILARPIDGAKPGQPLYEVVCGERRWRACGLAQLPSVMAIVRPMGDMEAVEIQLIENLKRSDLTELEEADGYRALLRKPDGLHGYTNVDELAGRIGKSRSYVHQRLKLLDLKDAGRAALASGKVSFSVALLIARLHTEADQARATKEILQGWGGEPYTYTQAVDYIHRTFHLDLSRAAFSIVDETLLPEAGSCKACAKRTGANPDLFDDVRKADTCTDAPCYQAKEAAHRARLKAEAEARGAEVITGAAAKKVKPQAYGGLKGMLELDKVHLSLGDKPLRKLLGKPLPEVLVLEDPHTKDLVEVVREAEALALLRERGAIKATRMPSTSAAERDAERQARQEVAVRKAIAMAITEAAGGNAGADTAYRMQLLVDVGILLWSLLSSDQERRVEQLLAWEHIGSEFSAKGSTQRKADRIRALDEGAFTRYLTAALCSTGMYVSAQTVKSSKPTVLLDLAARLGVDANAIREEHRELQRVQGAKPAKGNPPPRKPAPAAVDTTPETALAAALRSAQAKPRSAAGVKYRHPITGETWTGRGLKPAWFRQALDDGLTLEQLAAKEAAAPTLSAAAADPFRGDAATR